ncbi:TnsD family transposase [Psychrobacillus psychrodurans]|uniref:TnsD family Tn7-like transposition protein n=1 Tax=Psychrobacillus psychrodurans TaxID=126157 RepID=UPI001F4DAD3F|nr:TnsD family Tn7-like transposition protein [Psychrobacillus psychrodurans]MCK1997437.1 TnsD family transposase [Psychrobacillus psychrodurans]
MLTFFTDPYKDELVYSSIARYHFYSGNINLKDTLEELFRSRTVIASVGIGFRFSILAEQLGNNYSVEGLLTNHTIYPYYSPFLSVQRQQEVLSGVKGTNKGLYRKIGMSGSGICKKGGLYYCSSCAIEDIEKYGEPYIHREHQLQGIEYCAHHETKLKKYSIEQRMLSRYEYIRFDEKVLDLSVGIRGGHNESSIIQIKLAKMAYQLFQIPNNKFSREIIALKYRTLFRERGLITFTNQVRRNELYRIFLMKFPKGFLEKFGSLLDVNSPNNWLDFITLNTKRHVPPFRHLLLIYFLDQDIESLLAIEPDQGPFGAGPWPCLNKTAKHFEQDVVNKLVIKRKWGTKNPKGEFHCSCGFVYTRIGPDKTANDKKKITSIKNYGDSWNAQLKELHKSGLSPDEIAKQLEVSNTLIINRLRKGEKSKCYINPVNDEELIKMYRIELIKGMEKYPGYGRTELSKRFKKVYKFLLNHDKEWFKNNIPIKEKKILLKKFDWKRRDQEYLVKINALYEELLELDKPVRITRSVIGKRLDIRTSIETQGKAMKIPQTNNLLKEITESVQDFQIRRCLKIIDSHFEDGEPVALWKVKKCGGVKSNQFNQIKPLLERYLKGKMGKDN